MRIVSLLPSATEILYSLGLGSELVGVSHACDYPAEAKTVPVMTECALGPDAETLPPGEIDRRMRELSEKGERVIRFKPGAMEEARPELVFTQGVCDVCAVSSHFVVEAVKKMKPPPEIMSLDPEDMAGIVTSILRMGEITATVDAAGKLAEELEARIGEIAGTTADFPLSKRPRVAVLEWTEPLYAAGHWIPEMVHMAGGHDVLAKPAEKSQIVTWDAVLHANPEVLIIAPCGRNLEAAKNELASLTNLPGWDGLKAVRNYRVFFMDSNAALSRPGPRVAEGLEALAHILHPDVFGAPANASVYEQAVLN